MKQNFIKEIPNKTIMVNATMNETLANLTAQASQATQSVDIATATILFFTVVIPEVLARFFIFLAAPFIYPEMWWLLIHLILTFVLFEFYFERHQGEDLGWSAALANSIVMVFVSMELLRALYHHNGTPFSVLVHVVQDYLTLGIFSQKIIILTLVILLGILGLATAVINYFHFLPRELAFIVSGHKTVNLLAYFLMVIVWRFTNNNPMPIDITTLVALIMFAATLWFLLLVINHERAKKRAKRSNFTPFD